MRVALNELEFVAPLLGAGVAGCPWWVIIGVGVITIFLHGPGPAMRWLDVLDRVRRRHQREDFAPQPPDTHSGHVAD
jgi:hypothetical protein